MITLHGFPYSNYYNIVKHVLLHKNIPFEEDLCYGGDEDEWLALSPVGKVPAINTEQGGHLSESSVCCDYLEETYPEEPLYPGDSFARNYVRQIMKISELYLELPSRRLVPFIFSNTDAPDELKTEIRTVIERGVGGLTRLCEFDPYLAGGEMTMADIYLRYVMFVVDMAGAAKLEWDVGAEIPGLKDWQAMMADTEISKRIDADREASAEEFFARIRERFGT